MLHLKSSLAALALAATLPLFAQEAPRPPMVPLTVHNPHFGIWSPSDKLNEGTTKHSTQRNQPLYGYIWIDGQAFRVIGSQFAEMPALPQTSLQVLPTRTVFTFANDKVKLTLTFTAPVLPDDLEVLARPVNRSAQTKTDWQIWCASLTSKPEDVAFFRERIRSFFDQVPERYAAVDWHNVDSGRMIGFTARSVIGGLFAPFLNDPAIWKKYSRQDMANPKTHIWAPLPLPPTAYNVWLKAGAEITIAVHCRQTNGGQFIDVGIVAVK